MDYSLQEYSAAHRSVVRRLNLLRVEGLRIIFGSWIRSRIKDKIKELWRLKMERGWPWTLTIEARRPKMKLWIICIPVVADLNHCDEEQIRIRIRIRIKLQSQIRIRI